MVNQQDINLTLEELATEVAHLLEYYSLLGASSDSRVSPVPDARTIRYYTTLGILDRPRMDGRVARYNKRHVLQLLAIKALQAHGLPLAEVQSRLLGMSDSELEALLVSLSQGRSTKKTEAIRPVIWKEVVVEPGLKLMVEDGWNPGVPLEEIQRRINAVLSALKNAPDGAMEE